MSSEVTQPLTWPNVYEKDTSNRNLTRTDSLVYNNTLLVSTCELYVHKSAIMMLLMMMTWTLMMTMMTMMVIIGRSMPCAHTAEGIQATG